MTIISPAAKRQPVPRGIATEGPVLFSYGFRPFFLGAGFWAVAAMVLWIGALVGGWEVGGSYGPVFWHAHEMLFGFGSAALAGFLLTAVPNWTGRLPVSGWPLVGLFAVWCAGRAAMVAPDVPGPLVAVLVDAAFLPLLLAICAREIVAGRKWRDLKLLLGVLALAGANAAYHAAVLTDGDAGPLSRAAIGAFVMLVTIIGGRVVPSFTRNWLARREDPHLPTPFNRFDVIALAAGLVALLLWAGFPDMLPTAAACLLAAVLHLVRLARWRGWRTRAEALVLILHLGYLFVPAGFLALALVPLGLFDPVSALHVLTVGTIGTMILAIMTRATRGHTGLPLAASPVTVLSYVALIGAAVLRPLGGVFPDSTIELSAAAGGCWLVAFGLYLAEYGPVLVRRRR